MASMPPKTLSYSVKLVINGGSQLAGPSEYHTGPNLAKPTNPVVLVATPSIDFDRKLTSSTNTPGARYSGITIPLFSC
jgi:hypothetical protein